jgi:hypothetical protein
LSHRYATYSWDGSKIYHWGRHNDGSEGIRAVPAEGGEPSLIVVFDNPELRTYHAQFVPTVSRDHLYLSVGKPESDIWIANVEVER